MKSEKMRREDGTSIEKTTQKTKGRISPSSQPLINMTCVPSALNTLG